MYSGFENAVAQRCTCRFRNKPCCVWKKNILLLLRIKFKFKFCFACSKRACISHLFAFGRRENGPDMETVYLCISSFRKTGQTFGISKGGDTEGSCCHCTRNGSQFHGQLPEGLIKSNCIQGRHVSDHFSLISYSKVAKCVHSKNKNNFYISYKISK